jgi:hypothetical protein
MWVRIAIARQHARPRLAWRAPAATTGLGPAICSRPLPGVVACDITPMAGRGGQYDI